MDFELTAEQTWLAESVAELLSRHAEDDGIVAPEAADAVWRALVEFGAIDIGTGDDGLGAVELAIVARQLGERLAAVPFTGTASFRYVRGEDHTADARGVALGLAEPGRSFAPSEPSTTFDGALVVGEKMAVTFADRVDAIALTALAEDGPVLVLARAGDPAVTLTVEATLDPTLRPAHLRLEGAGAERVLDDVPRVAQIAATLASAESVGAASAVLSLAAAYAAQRRQFGRTIGSFQAVRHLLADAVVGVESSWSSVLYAAASLDERAPDASQTVSITKAWVSRATLDVAQHALQVFGGVAFTAEHPAHRFLRRIAVLGGLYGTARDHERVLGRTLARQLEVIA
jgi:alkylation response protein AidB-like acyl-CoA dehydrogenase